MDHTARSLQHFTLCSHTRADAMQRPPAVHPQNLDPIPVERLLSASTPAQARFTCDLAQGRPLSEYGAQQEASWPHRRIHHKNESSSSAPPLESGIGLGMMVRRIASDSGEPSNPEERMLAAAHATWMRARGAEELEMVTLASCSSAHEALQAPRWLPATELRLHAWHWRCFAGQVNVTAFKLQGLLHAMQEALSPRRWYAKIEPDTLLIPTNLLRLLALLDASTNPADEPIYYGSSVLHLHRPDSAHLATQPQLRQQFGSACFHTANARRNSSDCVLQTAEWEALVQQQAWSQEQQRVAHATRLIQYAQGGFVGLSRHTLRLVVRSRCLQAVGALPCRQPGSSCGLHHIEDAAVGLCMHLKQVRLLDCPAFLGITPARPCSPLKWQTSCADDTSHAMLPRFPISERRTRGSNRCLTTAPTFYAPCVQCKAYALLSRCRGSDPSHQGPRAVPRLVHRAGAA